MVAPKKINKSQELVTAIGRLTSALEKQVQTYGTINKSTETQTTQLSKSRDILSDISGKVEKISKQYVDLGLGASAFKEHLSETSDIMTGVLTGAIGGALVTALTSFNRAQESSIALMREFRGAYSAVAKEVGAVGKTYDVVTKSSQGLAGAFKTLGLSVGESVNFMEKLRKAMITTDKTALLSMRESALRVSFAFGAGTESGSKLIGTLVRLGATQKDVFEAVERLEYSVGLYEELGISTGEVMRSMADMPDLVARFGGPTNIAYLSRVEAQFMAMGTSLKQMVSAFEKFDTISGASETAARLNRVFGTTFTTLELLTKTDPAERMEYIVENLRAMGIEYQNLDYASKKVMREALPGFSEETLVRITDVKNSYKSISELMLESEQAQESEAKKKEKHLQETRKLTTLVYDTSVAMMGVYSEISKFMQPVWDALFGAKMGLIGGIKQMFATFNDPKNAKAERWMKDLAVHAKNFREILISIIKGSKEFGETFMKGTGKNIGLILDKITSLKGGEFNSSLGQLGSGVNNLLGIIARNPVFYGLATMMGIKIGGFTGVLTTGVGALIIANAFGDKEQLQEVFSKRIIPPLVDSIKSGGKVLGEALGQAFNSFLTSDTAKTMAGVVFAGGVLGGLIGVAIGGGVGGFFAGASLGSKLASTGLLLHELKIFDGLMNTAEAITKGVLAGAIVGGLAGFAITGNPAGFMAGAKLGGAAGLGLATIFEMAFDKLPLINKKLQEDSPEKVQQRLITQGFATGGLVSKPTIGLVGEAGPELIVPLKNTNVQPVSMSTPSINVAVNPAVSTQVLSFKINEKEFASAVVQTAIKNG